MSRRDKYRQILFLLSTWFLVCALGHPAGAQLLNFLAGGRKLSESSQKPPPTTFLTDQRVLRRMNEADRLITEGRLSRALVLLQMVLDEPDDSFLRVEDGKNPEEWISVRRAAEDRIDDLGPQVWKLYRRLHEDYAADLLSRAIAAGDPKMLAHVTRRFLLTNAGFVAMNQLASYQLDRGHAVPALVYIDRLLECKAHHNSRITDQIRAKRAVAMALLGDDAQIALQNIAGSSLALGGTQWKPDALLAMVTGQTRPDKLALENWTVANGNGSRSAVVRGGLPLLWPEWSRPNTTDPSMKNFFAELLRANVARQRPTLYDLYPLAIEGILYYRDHQNIHAIDPITGEETKKTNPHWPLTGWSIGGELEKARRNHYSRSPNQSALEYTFVRNSVVGSLSSDGQRLYLLDQVSLNPSLQTSSWNIQQNDEESLRGRNRLTAIDLKTWKVVWFVGGYVSEGRPRRPLDDMFFFGPPLPVEDKLYVMGESKSEFELVCLDAKSGRALWSQVIALVERRIENDVYRRSQACPIAYADGILVCPTNLYRVVAVDPLTRSVLWQYSFHSDHPDDQRYQHLRMGNLSPPNDANATDPPMISGGRVIVTSSMGKRLHCLNLHDGRKQWSIDRSNDHYLAGIFDGHVVLVGRDHVRSVRLDDGTQEWSKSIPLPSGRAVCLGSELLVPLSIGKVVNIDIESGKLLEWAHSRNEEPIGNLLVHAGRIITAGHRGLVAYPLLDDVRKEADQLLSQDPKHPLGLFRQAQLYGNEGKPMLAVDSLLRALQGTKDTPEHENAANSKARMLLFDIASKEAIDEPVRAGEFVEELRNLALTDRQKGIYIRLQAEHRLATKDYAGSLDSVEQHAALSLEDPIPREKGLVLHQPSTWRRSLLARLLSAPEARTALETELGQRFGQATRAEDPTRLKELAADYIGLPLGDRAGLELGKRLFDTKKFGEAEEVLRRVAESDDPRLATRGCDLLARISLEISKTFDGQPSRFAHLADAHAYLKRIADHYPLAVLEDGRTCSDRLADFLEDPTNGQRQLAPWEFGKVEFEFSTVSSMTDRKVVFPAHNTLPFFYDRQVTIGRNPKTRKFELSVAHRATGKKQWSLALPYDYRAKEFEHSGHLMFFFLNDTILAVSALDQKQLWTRKFGSPGIGSVSPARSRGFSSYGYSQNQQKIDLGPVGPGFLCVRKGKELFVLDPWTGETIWTRRNLELRQVIFGDMHYLFLATKEGSYVVHRTLDGHQLRSGKFTGGLFVNRKDTFGRRLLVIGHESATNSSAANSNGRMVFRLWDPWSGKSSWSRSFPINSQYYLGKDRQLVVREPAGKMSLLDRETGQLLLSDDLADLGSNVANLFVFSDRYRHYLAIHQPGRNRPFSVHFGNQSSSLRFTQLVNGHLLAYDRQTNERLWERRLENRSLLLRPGEDLPVLLCLQLQSNRDAKGVRKNETSVEVIDKRDGKTLFDESKTGHTVFSELEYDRQDGWAELRARNLKLRMEFSGHNEAEFGKSSKKDAKTGDRKTPTVKDLFDNLRKELGDSIKEKMKSLMDDSKKSL